MIYFFSINIGKELIYYQQLYQNRIINGFKSIHAILRCDNRNNRLTVYRKKSQCANFFTFINGKYLLYYHGNLHPIKWMDC